MKLAKEEQQLNNIRTLKTLFFFLFRSIIHPTFPQSPSLPSEIGKLISFTFLKLNCKILNIFKVKKKKNAGNANHEPGAKNPIALCQDSFSFMILSIVCSTVKMSFNLQNFL